MIRMKEDAETCVFAKYEKNIITITKSCKG